VKRKAQIALRKLSELRRALQVVWVAARYYTLIWLALLLIQGLLPAALVQLSRTLVDSLTQNMGQGNLTGYRTTLLIALLIGAFLLLSRILQSIGDWIYTVQSELVRDHLSALIHEKAITIDMAFFESPEYYDKLYRAREDASNLPLQILENLGALFQDGITLLAMGVVLIPYGVGLPIVLLLTTLPAFFVVLRNHRLYHDWWRNTTTERRRGQYFDWMLTMEDTATELRLLNLGGYFQKSFREIRKGLRQGLLDVRWRQTVTQVQAALLALLLSAGVMLWMIWRALQGAITLGDLVLLYQALEQGQGLLATLLGNVGKLYRHLLFISNLFEFLDLQPAISEPEQPTPMPQRLQQGICFTQVTFHYPHSERMALEDFNLTIPAGQTIAIVGANGAGKSTLVKLLCRFYDPEQGAITLDGVDLRQLSLTELRSQLAVMFQLPTPYQATARENIAISRWQEQPATEEIELAARHAGAHEIIERLPQGYATMLGKWFVEGVGLSTGEWQRLALARSFLREGAIIILDEPTSAMDSWAEAEWLDRFRLLVKGRTAIIITHRFTTAMRADVIHVMQEGKIVESGSHEQLLAQQGLYAQSWLRQIQEQNRQQAIHDDAT
jgi:ATP-binding cassette subfamily B protein